MKFVGIIPRQLRPEDVPFDVAVAWDFVFEDGGRAMRSTLILTNEEIAGIKSPDELCSLLRAKIENQWGFASEWSKGYDENILQEHGG